jgi:hypothetical protein
MLLQHEPGIREHIVRHRIGKRLDIDPSADRNRYFKPDSAQWWRKGVMPQRDAWRQRCYDAEQEFVKKVEQRTFGNRTEVAKYVRDFMEKPWFQRRFPLFEECRVMHGSGCSISRGGPDSYVALDKREANGCVAREVTAGHITVSSWGMGSVRTGGGEVVVLHELAHAVLPAGHRHDRRWTRTFLEFVGCAMGYPARQILAAELRRQNILFSPFKQIRLTDQHMAWLAAARPNPKRGG